MKDILKFALSAFLMLLTLSLVSIVFIQSFIGDYDWLNLLLTALYALVVIAAAFYEGIQKGAKDCKYGDLMGRQQEEHGHVMTAEEAQRCYRPYKGIAAGLIASSPSIVLAIAAIAVGNGGAPWVNVAARLALSSYMSLFQYVSNLLPILFLPLSLIYPIFIGIAYLFGPKAWKHQVAQMEKAKREKKRRVNRKKKRSHSVS